MHNKERRQKGSVAVEATIVLPILVFFLLIIIDFGRVMYASITTTNAARAAAGYGAQSTHLVIDNIGIKSSALSDATNLIVNSENPAHVATSSKRICKCPNGSTISCTSNLCPNQLEIYVEVTATRQFSTLTPFPLIPPSINISKTATIRVQ